MTFLRVGIAGLGLLLCCVAVGAQEQDLTKVQIKVTKVAGSVYMLEGSDAGNIGASVGEDIRALYFPAGHTDGDSIIFFSKSNVVHMGDDFVTYGFPFIDVGSGGSIDGMIDGVEKVIAQVPPDVKIIPGHGPISSVDDMRVYVKMLKDTRDLVAKGIKEGKSFDDMKQAKILDPWKKYSGYMTEDTFLETLYASLTGQKTGKFIKHN